MLEISTFTLFPGLLIIAAVGDLMTFRIPNWISVAVAVLFGASAAVAGLGWLEVGSHVALGGGLLLVGMGMFSLNLLGGGDAKLFAAIGLWMGWGALPAYLIWVTLAGGVLAASVLLFRRVPISENLLMPGWVARLHRDREGIPYGIAISAGGLMALPNTVWFGLAAAPF